MVDQVRGVLHALGSALLWPVLAGLVLLTVWMCLVAGAFLREWYVRRTRGSLAVQRFRTLLGEQPGTSHDLGRLLQQEDDEAWHGVARVRRGVRLGPALGLMGTLIPMASALQGLASGDYPKLAGNLVTAFSATVVGLAISVVAVLIGSVREYWVQADSRERAYLADTAAATPPAAS